MQSSVERCYAGEPGSEENLFGKLFVRFRLFALKRVDEEKATEIAQDACVTVFKKFRHKISPDEFMPWSYGVLKMTMKRHHQIDSRRREREIELPEGVELPDLRTPDPMLHLHLNACLDWLARNHGRYAEIFNLHRLGYTTSEVCAKLKLNSGQYYVYLGRSRIILQECLEIKGAKA